MKYKPVVSIILAFIFLCTGAVEMVTAAETAVPQQSDIRARTQELQERMLNDKDIMAMIMVLQNDPEMQALLNDPAVQAAIYAGDYTALIKDPRFMQLLNDPRVREIHKRMNQ